MEVISKSAICTQIVRFLRKTDSFLDIICALPASDVLVKCDRGGKFWAEEKIGEVDSCLVLVYLLGFGCVF